MGVDTVIYKELYKIITTGIRSRSIDHVNTPLFRRLSSQIHKYDTMNNSQ